ncbi:hypothetical protein L6164_019153 [Bauhinia variegata]|uniref:Uncharacterized protein n=1 Tax=Bauhinia variegata TaxID=167791 RepID=A0ACB9NID2_BAUVA|nr:hypothetical protein L6164_019153 [Bauhinia variegata]
MEMQQRPSSSASRLSGEQRSIHITPTEHPEAKRRRTNDDLDGLPLYDPRSTIGKREFSHSRSAGKWIHAIPVLVLFCFFMLWWFSFPVTVLIEDGRITAIRQSNTSILNDTRIDLTILAVSATPIPSILQNLSSNNEPDLHVLSAPN